MFFSHTPRMKLKEFMIKKMDIKDLDEVLSIANSSSLNPWSRNMFIEEILNPLSHCFVIQFEGQLDNCPPVGFICFRNIGEESELLNICVYPKYQKLGIAKELMKFYIEFCRQGKIKKFYLEVSASNHPAIHLYRLFSYQTIGVREKFYQGRFDAFLMRKED